MGGLTLNINGRDRPIASDPETPLLFVLRDELGLTGTKLGCGLQQCGACAVLADGAAVLSCMTPAHAFDGQRIETVEAMADHPVGRRVQRAFVAEAAAQCGYCTPGLVVAATSLLAREPAPDRAAALEALSPHLCRCGSHPRVLRAVDRAARDPR